MNHRFLAGLGIVVAGTITTSVVWSAESAPPPVKVFTTPWSRLFSGSESRFSTALTYSSPLSKQPIYVQTGPNTTEQRDKFNQRILFSLQYTPVSYFFANMTTRVPLQDTNKYSTDYVYSFGYDDWHPGTFSLVYGNYSEKNRFYPADGRRNTYFEQGSWTLAYKFSLPEHVEKHLLINPNDSLTCQVGYTYVARYYSVKTSSLAENKRSLLTSCGYTLKQHYFLRMSAFYYPQSDQQQPFDYDYTYNFGYVSSYQPGAITIQYSNYTGTRYPWRNNANSNFRQGSINLSWALPF
ncbi:hypothetical protein [Serratia fonticola]|uniref:Uncharacterized protein n=1 Tax=Serratia fonticola TaxID=47917 RepID=A0ABY9PH17_SERFO|nr:hypothetical protein [Serratia fonticola]WMT12681.1 hypothetical protein RFB13_15615 [Serratia fonticola]